MISICYLLSQKVICFEHIKGEYGHGGKILDMEREGEESRFRNDSLLHGKALQSALQLDAGLVATADIPASAAYSSFHVAKP